MTNPLTAADWAEIKQSLADDPEMLTVVLEHSEEWVQLTPGVEGDEVVWRGRD